MGNIVQSKPKAIDLFCGCGGTTVGLKSAGFDVVCAVDNASHPVQTYLLNHPEVKLVEDDIVKIECQRLMFELGLVEGQLDLLAGCPPCQGFSSIRTRNGKHAIKDDRNQLIFQFLRFVSCFRPKAVMFENVPGLKDAPIFSKFISEMSILGYRGGWKVLNASDFKVPQRRRRLIYVASLDQIVEIDESKQRQITVRDAISHLPPAGLSGDSLHDLPEKRTQRTKDLIAAVSKDGGSRSDLPSELQLACHQRSPDGFKDVYGRMAWDRPSPTITGGCASPSKGRFLHPEENRCITLREAAILQGFPEDYIFPSHIAKDKLALMIGNAFPPAFTEHHAKSILGVLFK